MIGIASPCCCDDGGPTYDPVACTATVGGTAPGAWELIYPAGLTDAGSCAAGCASFAGTWVLLPSGGLGTACAWNYMGAVDCATGSVESTLARFLLQIRNVSGSLYRIQLFNYVASGGSNTGYEYRYDQSGQIDPTLSYVIPFFTASHGFCNNIPASVTINPL